MADKSELRTVFLGLALEKQGKDDEAENAYNNARDTRRQDHLALQGLISLYEKQATKKLDEYGAAALALAKLHMEACVEIQSVTRQKTEKELETTNTDVNR